MHTLGYVTKKVVTLEESWLLAVSALSAEANLPKGTIVKMNEDGTVSSVTATTDFPLGMLTVGATEIGDRVTVNTQFSAITKGLADGAVAIGDFLGGSGLNTTEKLAKYKAASAGDYAIGLALSEAADGEEVSVGILRVAVKQA